MKRIGDLYPRVCSFENLWHSARLARRGKRLRPDVARFHHDLERNLLTLKRELLAETYQPGDYATFRIRDPKPRLISAAPYRDRVVHHALCRVIEPIFDRTFINDSYASRQGKGTHQALDRCTFFARRHRYVLKCDIEKYFPSIDHEILLGIVERKIKCPATLRLMRRIVANSNPQEEIVRYFPGDDLLTPVERRIGLPIGNLTSQLLANVMLNPFDHFVKEQLGCGAYVRFADDFLVFGDDRSSLALVLRTMQQFLNDYRLTLHPRKCQILPTRCGVEFLGWRVFPDHRLVRRSSGVRFQRRLRALAVEYRKGVILRETVQASIMSWIGHLRHGDTWRLRASLLARASFAGPPNPSRQQEVIHAKS